MKIILDSCIDSSYHPLWDDSHNLSMIVAWNYPIKLSGFFRFLFANSSGISSELFLRISSYFFFSKIASRCFKRFSQIFMLANPSEILSGTSTRIPLEIPYEISTETSTRIFTIFLLKTFQTFFPELCGDFSRIFPRIPISFLPRIIPGII